MDANIILSFENEEVAKKAAELLNELIQEIDEDFEEVMVADGDIDTGDIEIDDDYVDIVKELCKKIANNLNCGDFTGDMLSVDSLSDNRKYLRIICKNGKLGIECIEIDSVECPECGSVCWGYESWSGEEDIRCEACNRAFDVKSVFGDMISYKKIM